MRNKVLSKNKMTKQQKFSEIHFETTFLWIKTGISVQDTA